MKLILPGLIVLVFTMFNLVASGQVYDALGLKLLAQTRQSAPGKNVFLSPTGLALALGMVADGADGKTLEEIRSTLQLDPSINLNETNRDLLMHLTRLDPKIKLEIANSLWIAEDAKLKSQFLGDNRQFYRTATASVDFKNPATAQKINDWVNKHTEGKITKMVEPPLDSNRLILLDAIYFKGDWLTPFDKKLTKDLPFTLAGRQKVTAPRMSRNGHFNYLENETFQAVSIPYQGQAVSMYVFLPKKSLDEFLPALTPENWRQWLTQFHEEDGTVELPSFKLENEYDLKAILSAMGMPSAFSRAANFSRMSDEALYIDWIKQKTYVDVNEQGTEAAAVTGTGMRAMAARRISTPFRMVVDRPFFIVIRERETGAMLFLGAVVDPRG